MKTLESAALTFYREYGWSDDSGYHRGPSYVLPEDSQPTWDKWGAVNVKNQLSSLFAFSKYRVDENNKLVIEGLLKGPLAFDFDGKNELDVALLDARHLVKYLVENGVEEQSIAVWFSGSKGFHVLVHMSAFGALPSENLPKIYKELAISISGEVGLKTTDRKIYHNSRLFRIPLTYNAKGNAYKIGLSLRQLFDLDIKDIQKIAHGDPKVAYKAQFLPGDAALADKFKAVAAHIKLKSEAFSESDKQPQSSFVTDCPCIAEIRQGVDEGMRNEACYFMALHEKLAGRNKTEVQNYLSQDWNPHNAPNELQPHEIQSTVDSVFSRDYKWSCDGARDSGLNCDPAHCPHYHTSALVEQFLKRPSLLADMVSSLDDKIIGERDLRAMLIALNIGQQSLRVSGDSSTGKNSLVDAVLDLFPSDTWLKIMGWSDKAIRYLPPNVGTLYIAEMPHEEVSGKESMAEFDIKLMISEGGFTVTFVVKDPESNSFISKTKKTALQNVILTSTEVSVAPQLANRIWEVETDASAEQTRKVVERKLERWTQPKGVRLKLEPQRTLVKNAVAYILEEAPDPSNVIIPYANAASMMDFFTMVPRARRDADKLVGVIAALARVHFLQLPKATIGDEVYVIATPELYLLAYLIGKRGLTTTFSGITERLKSAFRTCMEVISKGAPLNKITLSADMGCSPRTANIRLDQLVTAGLIDIDTKSTGDNKVMNYRKSKLAEEMLERALRNKDVKMVYNGLCKVYEKRAKDLGYDPKDLRQQFTNPYDGKPCNEWAAGAKR